MALCGSLLLLVFLSLSFGIVLHLCENTFDIYLNKRVLIKNCFSFSRWYHTVRLVFILYLSFPVSLPPRGIQGQASVQHISKQPVCGGLVCFTVPAGGLMGVNRGQGRLRLHSSTLTEGRSLFRPHRLLVQ